MTENFTFVILEMTVGSHRSTAREEERDIREVSGGMLAVLDFCAAGPARRFEGPVHQIAALGVLLVLLDAQTLLRRGVVVAEAPFDRVVAGGRAEVVVGPLLRAFVPPQDDRLARVPEGRR